jgi:ABC-type uncharacterized transport system substrate-binding protein
MSYGPDMPDYFRKAAGYADKILHGAKPADLPVEQPTRLKQVINGDGVHHSAVSAGHGRGDRMKPAMSRFGPSRHFGAI